MRIRTPHFALGTTMLLALGLFATVSHLPRGEPFTGEVVENIFSKVIENDTYKLTYRWKDFNNKVIRISFDITEKELAEAEGEFGYTQEEIDSFLGKKTVEKNEAMIAELKGFVKTLIGRSGYEDYILIVDKGSMTFDLKLSVPLDQEQNVRPVYEAIKKQLTDEYTSFVKKIEAELIADRDAFFKSRGIVSSGEKLHVDYKQNVANNRLRMKKVLEVLRSGNEKINLRQFLSLSLSFIQGMKYGVPPIIEGDKYILGFWVPPKVLVNNFGDCDSKGVAFAALWTLFKGYPVILIKVPDHMFIGLGIPSMSSEGVVINGLRYTLCEVSGVQKTPPGVISYYSLTYLQSGRYQYEVVSR